MPDVIDEHRSEIEGICQRFGVARLDVFGSALGETFDLETSDIDFLVEMSSMTRVNAMLDTFAPVDSMGRQRLEIAQDFTDGIDELTGRLKTSKRRITAAVKASGTSLTEVCGLGPITAAIIIGDTGNIDRFATKARFASYNGTAPVDASSGPKVRHRLNPRGNRQLNWAIHVVAISQLRHDTIGRVFYDRKIEEGKTPKAAIRALKRRLSDVIYRHLVNDARRLRS